MREFLKGLELDKETIETIMTEHGKLITESKKENETLKKERDDLKSQIGTLNKSIEDLKKVNPDELNRTIEELQQNQKELEETHKKELENVKFNSKLDVAIANSKTIDPVGFKAHLDFSKMSYDEKTDSIIGFTEQLKTVQENQKYLFEEEPRSNGQQHGTLPGKDELKELDLSSALNEKYN